MIYLIHHRPLTDRNKQNQELFTETCFLLFGYNLSLLGSFAPDGETKFNIGWIEIVILSINLVAAFLVIVKDSI